MTTRTNLPGFLVDEIVHAGHKVRWHRNLKTGEFWQCEERLVVKSEQKTVKGNDEYPMEEFRYYLWQQAASRRQDTFSPGSHLEIKNVSSRLRIVLGWTPAR